MKTTDLNYKPNGKPSPVEEVLALADAEGIPEPKPGESVPEVFSVDGGHFECSPEGVRFVDGNGTAKRVCGWLRIEAKMRDGRNGHWGRLLVWRDGDGREHREELLMELLHGDSMEAVRMLAAGGLGIAPGGTALLRKYLQACKPKQRVRFVQQAGWHEGS